MKVPKMPPVGYGILIQADGKYRALEKGAAIPDSFWPVAPPRARRYDAYVDCLDAAEIRRQRKARLNQTESINAPTL